MTVSLVNLVGSSGVGNITRTLPSSVLHMPNFPGKSLLAFRSMYRMVLRVFETDSLKNIFCGFLIRQAWKIICLFSRLHSLTIILRLSGFPGRGFPSLCATSISVQAKFGSSNFLRMICVALSMQFSLVVAFGKEGPDMTIVLRRP